MTTVWSNMGVQTAPVANKALVVNGDSSITSVTAATSTTTGAFTVAGGVGIEGNLFVGGSVSFAAATFTNLTVTGALFHTPANATQTVHSSTVQSEANPRFYMDAAGKMNWGAGGASAVYDATLARDASGGKLSITGGLLVSQAVSLASTLSVNNSLAVGGYFSVQGSGAVLASNVRINGGDYSAVFPNITTSALRFSVSGVSTSTFTADAGGNMTWDAGMTLSTSSISSPYVGNMVFNYLNATGSFFLSASANTYIKGSNDNVIHAGNHSFNGINTFTNEIRSNSAINLLNPTSGFKTLTISSAGTLQFYSTTGVPGTALLGADSTGSEIWTAGPMTVNGLLKTKGIASDGDIVVAGTSSLMLTSPGNAAVRTSLVTAVTGASKIVTFPNATGNVVLDSANQTLTNKILAGESYSVFNGSNTGYPSATDKTVFNFTTAGTSLYGLSDANRTASSSKIVTIINASESALYIAHENVNAAPEDRITLDDMSYLSLMSDGVARLVYSPSRQRWIVLSVAGETKKRYLTTGTSGYFTATSEGNRNWIRGNNIVFANLSGFLASSHSNGLFTMPQAGLYSFSLTTRGWALNPAGFTQNFALIANINGTERAVYVERVDPSFFPFSTFGITIAFSFFLLDGNTIRFYPAMQNSAGGNYKIECDGFSYVSIGFTPS